MKKIRRVFALFLTLVLSTALCVPVFAATSTSIMSDKAVVSRICDIMNEEDKLTITLSDGVITQYSANNGDIVHVTSFNNGNTRYEYYCSASEKIYSFYDDRFNEHAYTEGTSEENVKVDVFDVAEYRENNTEMNELSDEEEHKIRSVMMQEESIEVCQDRLEEAGIENIIVSEKNGVKVASVNVDSIANTKAANATKTVNPTMQDLHDYQKVISWDVDGSASVYHNILGRNIQSRVYLFADNFVEKTMETTYVNAGLTLLSAAVLCTTSPDIFSKIIGWASVGYSAAGVLENFIFIDEQVYTYVAEKSGWTYDYISPKANGRHSGYAICYYNQTLGKITMGFDGLKERTNFHWAQTNPGIGDVYDLDNSYILDKAYQIYTSAVVSYGMYDAGYDGRVV